MTVSFQTDTKTPSKFEFSDFKVSEEEAALQPRCLRHEEEGVSKNLRCIDLKFGKKNSMKLCHQLLEQFFELVLVLGPMLSFTDFFL
jgi:hypothetical protein